jgi:hypothetical protein
MKNRIINGDMRIDQRNAGTPVTLANSTETFVVDRFVGYKDGGTIAAGQSSVAPTGFSNSIYWNVTTGFTASSGQYAFIKQHIEGFNTADLAFGTSAASSITLSFWVRSSVTGTYSGSLTNSAVNRSYAFTYTINSTNTWEYKTITIPGDTSGTWIGATNGIGLRVYWDLGGGSGTRITAGSWQSALAGGATGTTSVSATSGASFYVTGVQVEKGTTATQFDFRSFGTELQLCQRYYYQLNAASSATYLCQLQAYSSTNIFGKIIDLPVTMRATPTASASGNFVANNANGSGYTVTDVTIAYPNTGFLSAIWVASGMTAGYCSGVNFNPGCSIKASAEL